jgi:hypothetical protein
MIWNSWTHLESVLMIGKQNNTLLINLIITFQKKKKYTHHICTTKLYNLWGKKPNKLAFFHTKIRFPHNSYSSVTAYVTVNSHSVTRTIMDSHEAINSMTNNYGLTQIPCTNLYRIQ